MSSSLIVTFRYATVLRHFKFKYIRNTRNQYLFTLYSEIVMTTFTLATPSGEPSADPQLTQHSDTAFGAPTFAG